MNNKPYFRLATLLLVCQLLLVACTPPQQAGTTTGSTGQQTTTTTTATPGTTTVTPTPASTTRRQTTTVATTKPTVTTTTRDINVLPTGTRAQPKRYKMPGTPVLSRESEDYDVLRKLILQKFPGEKNLDEFHVKTVLETLRILVDDEFVQYKYYVIFTRWINGCSTDAQYIFYFDESGKCIAMEERELNYDPAKVVPPRVATQAEIEAAKQEEAKKVPEGYVIWKQEVSPSHYEIGRDANYFKITTLYVNKSTYDAYSDETSSYYGKTPPHSAYFGSYVIPR